MVFCPAHSPGMPLCPPAVALSASGTLPPALDTPRARIQTSTAGNMAYYADTSGGGRPLVLIHSINAAPSAFEVKPLFDHYRGRRAVFAPELPGFGGSDRTDRAYTPGVFAAAINEFLRSVVRAPADVLALSLTCEFAARAALDAPELFDSLIMVSPSGFSRRPPPGGDSAVLRFLRRPRVFGTLYALLTTRPSIRHFLAKNFAGAVPAEMVDYAWKTARQCGASFAPRAFLSMKLFSVDAVERIYRHLALPVLVLYDSDPNVSFERLEPLAATHRNWTLARISPTRGLPHFESPAATVRAMENFWRDCPPAQGRGA